MSPPDDPLQERARTLRLHGLLAHWDQVPVSWIESWITWEETERARRGRRGVAAEVNAGTLAMFS